MPLLPYYDHAGITLYHGDCREILPQLPPKTFDMVLTDPPYLVSYSGRWGSDWRVIEGDSDFESDWIEPAFREVCRTLKPDSLCFSFYGWPLAEKFLTAWKRVGFRPVSHITLIKDNWGLGYFTRAQHESAYLLAKGQPPKPETAISDVLAWHHPSPQLHPNQKPLGSISKLLQTFSPDGAVILDPLSGSGTTLVAARQLRRAAIGIEIEESFCELTAKRLSQEIFNFTGSCPEPQQVPLI